MKFLVIGLGSIGMRHAKNLIAMGHEVIGHDPIGSQTGIRIVSLDEIPNIDACIIASPTRCHLQGIVHAATAGLHMLVEKPIADRINNDLINWLQIARKKNLVVMVGNMLRFHPSVILARSKIKDPYNATFVVRQKNTRPDYLRDGVLLNWGAHEIDLALYLLGPAKVTKAKVREDEAFISLRHDNGAISAIEMDYITDPEKRYFDVFYDRSTAHAIRMSADLVAAINGDWNPIYIAELQAFIDRINGRETLGATADDGVATLKIIEEAKRMANGKG